MLAKKYAIKIKRKIKKMMGTSYKEGSEHRMPSLKEEKENCSIARYIESLLLIRLFYC